MAGSNQEVTRIVTITNELGMHARVAAKIAELAQQATAKIWITKDNQRVNAASIIDILSLGGTKGSCITLAVDEAADIDILNRIEVLVKNGFGE